MFDFDGTLYGDWQIWVSIIVNTLAEFQVDVDPIEPVEKARSMIEKGDGVNGTLRISGVASAIARDHGVSRDDEVRARFFQLLDARMDETGPDNRVVRLLEDCDQAGFRMGIVTFVRKLRITRRLDAWNFKQYFRSVVTPDDLPEVKPSPVPFSKAMREIGVKPSDCVVVGDEPVDMIGGKKAGALTVGLPMGFFSRQNLVDAGADHILDSIDLLPTVVRLE
ncbi:MAG TPA: HAD family hydrolase [Candidatus Bathyarchaeia archaeon]|nr:HAD family hydrolase [Candidatus Bathyarchaeia archaeon]